MADKKKQTRWSAEKPAKTSSKPDKECEFGWSDTYGCPDNKRGRNHKCGLLDTNGEPHMGSHECRFCQAEKRK